jgi:hypothetical protein
MPVITVLGSDEGVGVTLRVYICTLSLFLDSLFPKTEIPCMRDASSGDKRIRRKTKIALSGGIVLEEAVDLSSDRLLMNEYAY